MEDQKKELAAEELETSSAGDGWDEMFPNYRANRAKPGADCPECASFNNKRSEDGEFAYFRCSSCRRFYKMNFKTGEVLRTTSDWEPYY